MKEPDKIKKVALYIRVSTDRQAKEGDSLEAQETALKEYCKDKNYTIVDEYIDGGESGQKLKRTNLQRMLGDVKENKIDLILMTKLDRWFRNIGDFYKVIEIIKAHKTEWKTIWEDYDTTTASGEFWLNMSLSMGQLEAKRTSERINEVFNHKFYVQKTICSGSIPFGYRANNEKKLEVDDDKKEIVIELFNYYIKCNNLNKTARWFCNTYWKITPETIKKYLSNEIYIGNYRRFKTKEIIEGFAPPIIDKELFDRVQILLQKNVKNYQPDPSRKRHNPTPYIFSGLLKCPVCGCNLSGKVNLKCSHYYNCKKHERNTCTNKKCVSEIDIENYFLNNIQEEIRKKKLEIYAINNFEKKQKIDINALKNKMNKLTNLYMEELIDYDYYKKEYNDLKSKIEIAKEQNKPVKVDKEHIEKADALLKNNFLEFYNTLDNLEKRKIWSSLVDYAIITDKNNIEIVVY